MRRNPLYVFNDLDAIGIFNVPLESTIQIIDSDRNGTPKTVQIIGKTGLGPSSTIEEFLNTPENYIDQIASTEIPSELEKLEFGPDDNKKVGWRLLGAPETNYGPIGEHAIDLSNSTEATGLNGALGLNSFATGLNTTAKSENSTASGWGTVTSTPAGTSIGRFNVDGNGIFEVGIGTTTHTRKNAFEVYTSGELLAPETTLQTIESNLSNRVLVTREYTDHKDNFKLDKAGGTITGDLEIERDLTVHGNTSLKTLEVARVNGPVEFTDTVELRKDLKVDGVISSKKPLVTGLDQNGDSFIEFQTTAMQNGGIGLVWDNTLNEFQLKTLLNTGKNTIWHRGNLDPNAFLSIQGGTILQDLEVMGHFSVHGESTIPTIKGDVELKGALKTYLNLDVGGVTSLEKEVVIGTPASTNVGLSFFDSASTTPRFYWDQTNHEFRMDTGDGVGRTVWNSKNFDPKSKIDVAEKGQPNGVATLDANGIIPGAQLPPESVTSVNTYNINNGGSDVVLVTGDIQEGQGQGPDINLWFTDARADLRVQAAIDDTAGIGATTKLWSADKVQKELDKKLDLDGGGIQGDLHVDGNITATGNLGIQGEATLPKLMGNVEIQNNLKVGYDLEVGHDVDIKGGRLDLGVDAHGQSTIRFTDGVDPARPSIRWDTQRDSFLINTVHDKDLKLWHTGNFDPNTKYDKAGGIVFGDAIFNKKVQIKGDADIQGAFTHSAKFEKNVVIDGSLVVKNDIHTSGTIRTGIDTNGQDSLIVFTDIGDPGAMPKIYWDGFDKEFKLDDLNHTDNIIWHSGNIDPVTEVNGVPAKNRKIQITTKVIPEDVNLYYTNDRVLKTVQQDIKLGDISDVSTSNIKDGQVLKWNINSGKWEPATDIAPVTSVNAKTGNVVLITDDIQEGTNPTNMWFSKLKFDEVFKNYWLDDTASDGDFYKVWSADKIHDELAGKVNTTGANTITGSLTVTDTVKFLGAKNDLQHIGSNLTIDEDLTVIKEIRGGSAELQGMLTLGLNDQDSARIHFNDITAGTKPSLYWDQTGKTFMVTTDTGGPFELLTTQSFTQGHFLKLTGGTISGDLGVQGKTTLADLEVTNLANLKGGAIINKIAGDLVVEENTVFNKEVEVKDNILVGRNIEVGSLITGTDSQITFTDHDHPLQANGIRWDQVDKTFYIDVNGTSDNIIWHSGNFNPRMKISQSEKGTPNGVASLDSNGIILSNQLPPLAITHVHVVQNIADRDKLVQDGKVQQGDIAKVIDSDGNNTPMTYIWDGSTWVKLHETSDVLTVNNMIGNVLLETGDIQEGKGHGTQTNLYYTESRFDTSLAAKSTDDIKEGTKNLYFTAARANSLIDAASALTRAGAGLNADGSYKKPTTSNYIDKANNLNDATLLLDNQIKSNFDQITAVDVAIQRELDATQHGAGLNVNGDYVQDNKSPYIRHATSLADADTKLADQIKVNADDIQDLQNDKVDKVPGMGLSSNDYDDAAKKKVDFISITKPIDLDQIDVTAEANVQSDWAQLDNTKDSFIRNKPVIPNVVDNLVQGGKTDALSAEQGKNLKAATDDNHNNFILVDAAVKQLDTEVTANTAKLSGIEAGANKNVQPDWLQTDNTKDDYIKNKPTSMAVDLSTHKLSELQDVEDYATASEGDSLVYKNGKWQAAPASAGYERYDITADTVINLPQNKQEGASGIIAIHMDAGSNIVFETGYVFAAGTPTLTPNKIATFRYTNLDTLPGSEKVLMEFIAEV